VVGFQIVLLAAGGLAIMTAYAGYLEALKVCVYEQEYIFMYINN
jgi:hypothetical protein